MSAPVTARDPADPRAPEYAILGAGALGSILGAHLTRAAHAVVMLARGRRAEQIRAQGLRIKGLVELTIPVTVVTDPAELTTARVLIVATKTPGTDIALAALRHARIGAAFSIQNGTLKDELLAATFGAEHVLGALADTSGELLPNGEVLFTRNENILLGPLSGTAGPSAPDIAAAIDACGVRAMAVPNIQSLEWSKFAIWVGLFVLSVLTRAETWRYLSDPAAARVLVRLVREMGALTRALGVELTDGATLPTWSLCNESEDTAVERVLTAGRAFATVAREHRMSSLQDLLAGRPLEVHETLGYAVRKAKDAGLALPLVENSYELIAAMERMRFEQSR